MMTKGKRRKLWESLPKGVLGAMFPEAGIGGKKPFGKGLGGGGKRMYDHKEGQKLEN